MDWRSWFAIGFTLHRGERNSWQNRRLSAKAWLTIGIRQRETMNRIATSPV
jgi:hypothetical protein